MSGGSARAGAEKTIAARAPATRQFLRIVADRRPFGRGPWALTTPRPSGRFAFSLLAGGSSTTLGPDVAPIHDRQMVVLERDDWQAWRDLSKPKKELQQPLAAGALRVEQVR